MKNSTLRISFAIGWLIMVTILLTLPGSSLPSEDWLGKIWIDKWVHVGLFSIGVILWCRFQSNINRQRSVFIFIAMLGLTYGIGMEFVQKYFIPERSFDLGDIAADGLGCLLGAVFSSWRYIKK